MFLSRRSLKPFLLVLIIWTLCILLLSSSTTRERARLAFDNRLTDVALNKQHPVADDQSADIHNNATFPCFFVSHTTRCISSEYIECQEKEELVDILLKQDDSGHFQSPDLIRSTCRRLPRTQQIIDIYGKGPVVLGFETCAAYRRRMSQSANMGPAPRVAGLYHSGTNALARLIEKNIQPKKTRNETLVYEVPWGKHIPVKYRDTNTFPEDHPDKPDDVLPIVIVRNPFDWMRSMCKEGYDALWIKSSPRECPHLLKPGSASIRNKIFVKAHQTQFRHVDLYDSLADFYSEWHRGYLNASFPRLLVRYEDLLLYPEKLLQLIAQCAGMPVNDDFVYYNSEAREFVKGPQPAATLRQSSPVTVTSTMFRALVKLGERDAMYFTIQDANRAYALGALDSKVLQAFQYQHLDDPEVPINGYVNEPGKNGWLGRREAIVNERLQRRNPQSRAVKGNMSSVNGVAGSLVNMGLRHSSIVSASLQSNQDETTQEAWDAKLMDFVKEYERRQQQRKKNEEARRLLLQARQRRNSIPSLSGRNQRAP